MAKLSSDGKYVTVERGDTLTEIAVKFAGGYSKYKQLAAINNISNPNLIYVGQKIYLTKDGSTPSGNTSSNTNKPTINQFGEQSNAEGVLFATWTWSKSNTESYKALWTYDTGSGVWFEGSNSTITVDKDAPELSRQSTYNVPSNARKVRFKVKPISKKKTKNGKETSYWEANWSDLKTWTDTTPLETPATPSVEIEKYKLTASLDNITIDAEGIEFEVVKDNAAKSYNTGKAKIVTSHVSFSCTVDAGSEYKVRCRAYKGSDYSDWSAYSSNEGTIPSAPKEITDLRALDEKTVYIAWSKVNSAKTYDIEYATKKIYFDGSNLTSTQTGIEETHYTMAGLQGEDGASGGEFFFRVRAVNDDGASGWCEPKSVKIGDKPAAPSTWSSNTKVTVGEVLKLYWVHNSTDGSSQTVAQLGRKIGDAAETFLEIRNNRPDDEKDKVSEYIVDTTLYSEGTSILWRVRTAGVVETKWSDWSIQRTVDIYAPPSLDLDLRNSDDESINVVTSFPIKVRGVAGPNTQAPIGYHVTISANEAYETVDNVGNPRTISVGDPVFERYIDEAYQHEILDLVLSAGDIDLENNISYTLTCIVSMNSGLSAETSREFSVRWQDMSFEPNAEISIDTDAYTASIRPYCVEYSYAKYAVNKSGANYTCTDIVVDDAYGTIVKNAYTADGLQVFYGTDSDGKDLYYCEKESTRTVDGVLLSVYRREFDGGFTELATGLQNGSTTIVDPHPSLDYARYRIVAVTEDTGAVSFYDPPGYPIGGNAVIIQWDEAWSTFDVTEESALVQPAWSGSLIKLPYNIDVSDSVRPDVALVEYIGRAHPVAYYGTQIGASSNWKIDIPKSDKETLYALRRLANWMGNVYVREPSGSGYWANIVVSFSQTHCNTTIPVSFDISRVEGGA